MHRFLLQEQTVAQPHKFLTFYGTRKFITVFTNARPLVPFLSQMNPDKPLSYLTKVHYFKIKIEPACISHGILQQIAGF
jgi:hypothetical protein